MTINDAILQTGERITLSLRELYLSHGYQPYRMSKFEEYDLYARNKDFLPSDRVITFTDTAGKLMALKPDVTLSIIKNGADQPNRTQKVFYNENVYRVSRSNGSFKEIMQVGVECFGRVGEAEIAEVLEMAAQSLRRLSPQGVLAVSDLELIDLVLQQLSPSSEERTALYQAMAGKNLSEMERLCARQPETLALLEGMLRCQGSLAEVTKALSPLFAACGGAAEARFYTLCRILGRMERADMLRLDFSVISDTNYYNGIIFKGFLRGIPTAVLSGGQYDRLMRRLGRTSSALGFAVYTDTLERLEEAEEACSGADDFVNIALPKGRLGEQVYDLFARAGFPCPSILEPNRKLIFENPQAGVRYFWVKPSDVSIYVERGAADIGVAGKDILLEYEPDVYELLDLRCGKCRMAVAAPNGERKDVSTLRVATKFSHIATRYYRSQGQDIDIIHLNGSIELAPILGLSDVIVDIVETGTTLRENHLEVVDTIVPISARLIANKSAFKFKSQRIERIKQALEQIVEEKS